ncbi:MAG: type II toxin-antitoxin system VapC family toxin [Deltaproteobacteria bacterium]|nr:type II toxin-antitoxin system VapC family toxin [Deltaproteobacteria bacterium]
MNFFDASALVKRYVRETGSSTVRRLLREVTPAISRLTEAEVSSAFARRRREGTFSSRQHARALAALQSDLLRSHVIELSTDVVARVHVLVARHPVRAADALQLASAIVLREAVGRVVFVAYDTRLREAARAEGFSLSPGRPSRSAGVSRRTRDELLPS